MINYRIINILGMIIIFLGLSMIPSALWSIYFKEYVDLLSICKSMMLSIIFGLALYFISYFKKSNIKKDLLPKDGFAITVLFISKL